MKLQLGTLSRTPKLKFRKLYVEEGLSHDAESLKRIIEWMPKVGYNVLVDKYGRPVVRCKCGNPLTWPKNYPKIRCKGCPPDYKPPKPCKWRIYDPWYPYPPDYLPPEWRDPYPKSYPKRCRKR